jgi:predicted lipoprotein with Yx(FWY)xxD motif
MIRRFGVPAAVMLAALLGACNSDDSDDSQNAGGAELGVTVSVAQDETLGEILVDSSGAALYTSEQETNGTIACQDGCADQWRPLTVDSGQEPTASDEVTATLSTMDRSDGTTQVTLNGVPLYTFQLDRAPGEVTGDGLSDDFDGTTFTWHVARPDGTTGEPAPPDDGGVGNY